MPASVSGSHVKIGDYEFLLDQKADIPYEYTETTEHRQQGIAGAPNKFDIDDDERLLWRMSDWSGGEGQRYWDPQDPTVYEYSEETAQAFNTQGQAANVRRAGQVTGRPLRTRVTATVTDFKQKAFLAIADGRVWLTSSHEAFYSNDPSGAWTAQTDNFVAGHVVTAAGGSEDWLIVATADPNSRALQVMNKTVAGTVLVTDHVSEYPWRERIVMYNGRAYGWTGRKLFEFDIFDAITDAGTVPTPLVLNANPGYRKVGDTGSNEMNDGNYGGSSLESWWADIVASEDAVYCMVGNRGQTRIYQFKGGVFKPIWFPPLGFTCKSLAVQNGVLFAFGQWGGETSTTHKGGAAWALPLRTMQPVHLAWFREHTAQTLHMQEAAASYGSQVLVAACNTGRVFIYDMETDGVSMLDKLPYNFSNATPNDGTAFPSGASKIGSIISYGEYRVAAVYEPRSTTAGTTIQTFAWTGDQEDNRAASNANHDQEVPLFMPYYNFSLPYETKALHGFHIGYKVEGSTTSGLLAGQEIEIGYALDNGTFVTLATMTSSTTPSSGVKGQHFMQASTAASHLKFYQMKYKVIMRGKSANTVVPPIVKDVTVEAKSLDHDRQWRLMLLIQHDSAGTKILNDRRFASDARTYIRALKSNKNMVTFLDYYRYQTGSGADRNTSSSHTVYVHAIRDVINRNGEGTCEVVLKAVKS